MNEDILTAKLAADIFGIHIKTLYTWARKGTIPAVKLGGTWIFSRAILKKFLEDRMKWRRLSK